MAVKSWREDISSFSNLNFFCSKIKSQLNQKQILLLQGPMGAGKTTFVRSLCEAIDPNFQEVSSPTFALHNSYLCAGLSIEHFDFFRLKSIEEIDDFGFWDLLQASHACVVAIEWPELIKVMEFPKEWKILRLQFEVDTSGSRFVQVKPE